MKTSEEIDELMQRAVEAGLEGLDFMADFDYEKIAASFNGIGPSCLSEEQRQKLSKYLALFLPAALIHDMRYEVSNGQRDAFNYANFEFRDNCYALATHAYGFFNWRRYRAYFVAWLLFKAVASEVGWFIWSEAARSLELRAKSLELEGDSLELRAKSLERMENPSGAESSKLKAES